MPRDPKPWGAADMRRRCRQLREQLAVAASDVITPQELAAYWPGGPENQNNPGVGAWIYCYANLVRLCDRLRTEPGAADGALAERARVDGLVDRAVPVTLQDGTTVHVHPLGYVALEFLTTLDRTVALAQELAATIAHQQTPESQTALVLEPQLRADAVQLWAWILTSGASDLPFDPTAEDPAPPAWTRAMMPEDLLALYAAHRQVNAQRNALIASLFPSDTKATVRLSLAGFIGAYAHEKGADARQFMRTFSVGRLFAQAVSAAQQHDAAAQAAKSAREAA